MDGIMKLNGKTMMAMVMVIGAMAATGCSKPSAEIAGPVAPEESAATAPVEDDTATASAMGVEKDHQHFHYYAPRPPAARFEIRGRAPSARHFFAPGYYRYNGREHVWVAGRWEFRREGLEYIAPHWQIDSFGRWEYVPGRWIRVRRFF
jgi:hypothetical protein